MPYSFINADITDAEVIEIENHVDAIAAILNRYSLNLTAKERKSIPSVENRRLEFTTTGFEHADSHTELRPGYFDYAVSAQNFKTYKKLRPIIAKLTQVQRVADDLHHILGMQSYQFVRHLYFNIKRAVKNNVPGANAIYNDLKKLFGGQGNREHESPPMDNPEGEKPIFESKS